MKKMALLIVIAGLCLSGCTSLTEQIQTSMDSWMGAHESTLISQIGPPDRRVSDGKGGEVLVYERYVDLGQTTGKVYTDRFGDIRYTSPQQRGMNFVRMFYIDGKGYIYFWKTEGR